LCESKTATEMAILPFNLGYEFLQTVAKLQTNRWIIHYVKHSFFHAMVENDDDQTLKHYLDNHFDYFGRLWHVEFFQFAGENQKVKVLEVYLQEMKKDVHNRCELYDFVISNVLQIALPRRQHETVNLILKYFPKIKHYNNYTIVALECVRQNNLKLLRKIIRGPGLFYFYSIDLVCELVKEGKAKEYKQLLIWCWRKFNKDLATFNQYCSRKITYVSLKEGETYSVFVSKLKK
jgi:hypothetical protein